MDSRGAGDRYRYSVAGKRVCGDLNAVGIVAVGSAAGQATRGVGIVGGTITAGAAGRGARRPLRRVRPVRSALTLHNVFLGVVRSLRSVGPRVD